MDSKRIVVVGLGFGALLATVGACGHGSDTADQVPGKTQSAVEKGVGSADQPNDCGSFMGDAASITTSTDGAQFGGRITSAGSPAQNGWFGSGGTITATVTCDTPNPTPTVRDQGRDIHYNEIFLKNWTNADACISVWGFHLDHLDAAEGWQVAGFVGGFDPNGIVKNEVGLGNDGVVHFSFKVPANADFEVVVMAEAPYFPDGTRVAPVDVNWSVSVANCGQPSGGGSSGDAGGSSGGGNQTDAGGNDNGGDAGTSDNAKTW